MMSYKTSSSSKLIKSSHKAVFSDVSSDGILEKPLPVKFTLQKQSFDGESTSEGGGNVESDSDTFFNTELKWPMSSPSGITPAMLATAPQHRTLLDSLAKGADSSKQRSYCETLVYPEPPPRPQELPWNVLTVHSDPPTVDVDDVEEFLVHDALFVEYFNSFLALPAFPEPICFNMDSGGFEVVSDGRQKLANQIKEAVRSQNLTAKMYRLAKKHAFANIPLIPIEDTEGPEGVEIDTSFQVMTLNKDQGIYWIKAERLPLFLESDFYFQYRLAKVISQAKIFNDKKEFVVMKIDFTPRQKKVKKSVEEPPPNMEEVIVKQMYVSFGDVKGAAKEAWFTQAKDELSTNPSFTSLNPRMSSQTTKELTMASDKARPKSSVFRSNYFGLYSPGLVGPGHSDGNICDNDDLLKKQIFNERPFTPRPSETTHVSTDSAWKKVDNNPDGAEKLVKPGQVVFMQPKQETQHTDTESGIGEMDDREEELERRMHMQLIIDDIYQDGSWEPNPNVGIHVKSIDDLSSVIVGAVMKKVIAELLLVNESVVIEDPVIRDIYPSEDLSCIDVNSLERCYAIYDVNESDDEAKPIENGNGFMRLKAPSHTPPTAPPNSAIALPTGQTRGESDKPAKEPVVVRWDRPLKKSAEEESDADSLLDSDEDFDERDVIFRRRKDKWYNLTSMRGIANFKKFLEGTPGERYWELWVDIDKGRLLRDTEEEQRYSMYMRERYFKQGSPFELSYEDKNKLGLDSTGRWCPEYLFQIQAKVMEPLVLYWAPRYLLRNLLQSDPARYKAYSQMKATLPLKEADPFPVTKSLLPLRPKSCCPRTRQGPGFEEMSYPKSEVDDYKASESQMLTRPMTGNRRVYGDDTIQRLALTPTAKYLGIAPPPKTDEKSDFEKKCSRPATAGSSRSTSRIEDSSSAKGIQPTKKSDASVRSEGSGKKHTLIVADARGGQDGNGGEAFVGKIPGIARNQKPTKSAVEGKLSGTDSSASRHRHRCKSALTPKTSKVNRVPVITSLRPSSASVLTGGAKSVPCPSGHLAKMLVEPEADRTASGDVLAPVKKPRDLLSPMLRILDTKGQRSRHTSAVSPRCSSRSSENTMFYRQDSVESSKACDSRPSSANVKARSVTMNMTDCDFMGSERMETLLQALHHDQEAGKAFRKYMERTKTDQVALNCLEFWARVQDYRKLFYKDKLDLFNITKQAKTAFAEFIVEGAPRSIDASDSIELRIMQCLKPAYEDLFDEAEEHALKVLFASFLEFLKSDVKTYCKVERTEVTRRLETKNTYVLNLQKKGIIKERPLTPEDPMEEYVDPVYDETIFEKIPEELRDWTFDKLVHNRLELENFRQYLSENYAEIDLKCWMDMEAWRRTPPGDTRKRDQRARDIKKLYLNKKYFFGPSSPAGKDGQNRVMEIAGGWGKFLEDKPNPEMILEAQKYVMERLEKKHLPLFLLTKEFQDRQNPTMSQSDISDDVVVQKKRRSQAVLKVREEAEALFEKIMNRIPTKRAVPKLDHRFPHAQSVIYMRSSVEALRKGSLRKGPVRKDSSKKHFDAPTFLPEIELRNEQSVPKVGSKRAIIKSESLEASPSKTGSTSLMGSPKGSSIRDVAQGSSAKLLESKWVSSTKEIFLFKQALKNPVTCQQFQKYISIKGDNLENDLLFWLEVQRYKQMHHVHTEDSLLMQKINAIIHCFIDSPIPPSLQIDVPQEMAERILDHKHEKGPYLFRESQLAAFRILLAHWTPFCEFRNNMGSHEKAMKTLDRHRMVALRKEREYQEQLEKQRQLEKQSKIELEMGYHDELPDELKDEEEDRGAKISFSYADYLSKEPLHTTGEEEGTQTIRGIPEFQGQSYQNRPGFVDDPDVDPRAKEYTIEDVNMYQKYIMDEDLPIGAIMYIQQRKKGQKPSMLEKSSSSRQGSAKSERQNVSKGDNSIGDETDEIFQRHFRRTSQQSDRRRQSQFSSAPAQNPTKQSFSKQVSDKELKEPKPMTSQ